MKIQMNADFKLYQKDSNGFFRQLTKDDLDEVCPGGFTFEIDGKAISFDWDSHSTNEEVGIFHYESGYGPFFNDFEISDCYDEEYEELGLKREDITAEFLASVTNINDFYINLVLKGEDGDCDAGDNSDPNAEFFVEILSINFEDRETGDAFQVRKKVIKNYNGFIISRYRLLNKAYKLYKKDWCKSRGYDYRKVQDAYRNDEEYNGEMYVCRDEFENCEFRDESYIAGLLTALYPRYSKVTVIE